MVELLGAEFTDGFGDFSAHNHLVDIGIDSIYIIYINVNRG